MSSLNFSRFFLSSHSHIEENHAQPEEVLGVELATGESSTDGQPTTVVPVSYTEDLSFLSRDDDLALSCVYYERAVAVAQFGLTKATTFLVCGRMDKFAPSSKTAVVDLQLINNPYRDIKSINARKYVGSGLELQVRQRSLYATRHSRNAVYVKNWSDRSRFSLNRGQDGVTDSTSELVESNGALPFGAEVCLFDFQVGRCFCRGWEANKL